MPTIRRCYSCPEIVLERTPNCASVRLNSWSNYFASHSTLPTVELESRDANCRSVDSRLNTEQRCWFETFRPARVYESPNQLQLRKHSSAQHKTGQEPKLRRKIVCNSSHAPKCRQHKTVRTRVFAFWHTCTSIFVASCRILVSSCSGCVLCSCR